MTLRLSDDQLARLRLECWRGVYDQSMRNGQEQTEDELRQTADLIARLVPARPPRRAGGNMSGQGE